MKLRDYWQQLNEQQERLIGCPVATQVSESICLDSKSVTVTLGKDAEVTLDRDGLRDFYSLSMLPKSYESIAQLFKKYQDDFISVLEMLTKRVDEIVEASTELLTIIADQDIPELVLDRMAGAQLGKEPAELIETIAKKRLKGLQDKVARVKSPFKDVTWSAGDISGEEFTIAKDGRYVTIDWHRFGSATRYGETLYGTTQALGIIANYQKLQGAVDRFIDMLKVAQEVDNAELV